MPEGLCWECKQKADMGGYVRLNSWIHCHHEPREKPKCDYCFDGKLAWNIMCRDKPAGFCPRCGRKINPEKPKGIDSATQGDD